MTSSRSGCGAVLDSGMTVTANGGSDGRVNADAVLQTLDGVGAVV